MLKSTSPKASLFRRVIAGFKRAFCIEFDLIKEPEPHFTAMLYDLETCQTETINERDLQYWVSGDGRCDEVRGAHMGLWEFPSGKINPTYRRILLLPDDDTTTLKELNPRYDEACFRCYHQHAEALRGPQGGKRKISADRQQLFRGDVVEIHGAFGVDQIDILPESRVGVVLFSHSDVNFGSTRHNEYALMDADADGGRVAWFHLRNLRYLHSRAGEEAIQTRQQDVREEQGTMSSPQTYFRGDIVRTPDEKEGIVFYSEGDVKDDGDHGRLFVGTSTARRWFMASELAYLHGRVGEVRFQSWK